jgi:hypothetical protein
VFWLPGIEPGRGIKKRILEHVGSIDSTLEPRIHAQLDHATQAVAVLLKQVRKRLAVAASEPLNKIQGIAGIIRHNAHHTSLPAQRCIFGTKGLRTGS